MQNFTYERRNVLKGLALFCLTPFGLFKKPQCEPVIPRNQWVHIAVIYNPKEAKAKPKVWLTDNKGTRQIE